MTPLPAFISIGAAATPRAVVREADLAQRYRFRCKLLTVMQAEGLCDGAEPQRMISEQARILINRQLEKQNDVPDLGLLELDDGEKIEIEERIGMVMADGVPPDVAEAAVWIAWLGMSELTWTGVPHVYRESEIRSDLAMLYHQKPPSPEDYPADFEAFGKGLAQAEREGRFGYVRDVMRRAAAASQSLAQLSPVQHLAQGFSRYQTTNSAWWMVIDTAMRFHSERLRRKEEHAGEAEVSDVPF